MKGLPLAALFLCFRWREVVLDGWLAPIGEGLTSSLFWRPNALTMEPLDRNIDFNEELHPTFDPAAPPKYWFAHTFKQYASYRGRAGRFEYWNFQMWALLLLYVGAMIDLFSGLHFGELGAGVAYSLIALGFFLPRLMLAIRRMQDQNKSGWFVLVSLIPIAGPIWFLVLTLLPGTRGSNDHGPSPESEVALEGKRLGYVDNVVMWAVIWVAVSGVIWGAIRLTGNFDYYESPTFELANILSAYASGLMVVALGAVMPDKTKRTALIVIGAVVLLWRIAEVLMWIWESF